MATISAQITLYHVIDILEVRRYYILQSSTLTKPAKPTTYPPSINWGLTEPSYTEGSTNSLYFVDCTIFSDESFKYSEVSLSSSYEAAKAAYNKANAVETRVINAETRIDQNENAIELRATKTEVTTAINNLDIGGRNYIKHGKGDVKDGFFENFYKVENGYGEHSISSNNTYQQVNLLSGFILGCRDYEVGRNVTMSYDFMITEWYFPEGSSCKDFWIGQRYTNQKNTDGDTTGQWTSVTCHNLPRVGLNGCVANVWYHIEKTLTIPEQAAEGIGEQCCIQFYNPSTDVSARIAFRMKNVKLEYGNKATDWSPSPEEMATETKVNAAINNIEVGGRNLALNTSNEDSKTSNNVAFKIPNGTEFEACEYTLSFMIKADVECSFMAYTNDDNPVNGLPTISFTKSSTGIPIGTEWTRFEYTSSCSSEFVADDSYVLRFYTGSDTANKITVRRVKLEKGNKATDWTPAPEDMETRIVEAETAITQNAEQILLRATKTEVNSIEVGGRNLIINSSFSGLPDSSTYTSDGEELILSNSLFDQSSYLGSTVSDYFVKNGRNRAVTFSMEYYVESAITYGGTNPWIGFQLTVYRTADTGGTTQYMNWYGDQTFPTDVTDKWVRYSVTRYISDYDIDHMKLVFINRDAIGTVKFRHPKIEFGTKATDWTPAPEDMATKAEAETAQDAADNALASCDSLETRVTTSESTIQQLADSISMLITDENGSSLMTQTSTGWTFNIGGIADTLSQTANGLTDVSGDIDGINSAITNLNGLLNDIADKTAYIIMTTDDNGDPCIELGKEDNDFKVRITNTSVDFLQGSSPIAWINNNSLYIEKAIVRNELQIGESPGFVWKTRSNNNMGLRWIGG